MTETPSSDQLDTESFLADCIRIVGDSQILSDEQSLSTFGTDWTGVYSTKPIAIARPNTAQQISDLLKLCTQSRVAVVPQGGRTGLCGGCVPVDGQVGLVILLDRMNQIRSVDPAARTMTVEAGVVLQTAQARALENNLVFPLTFGAQGSCMLGGALSTNAGGSNVVRYGNTRELCLGIEAVLPDGSFISTLSGLRKDNTGYDLKDLLIGAEGTLGIITAAVFKLSPKPQVYVSGFLSVSSMGACIEILNKLQDISGGGVEAYEYMPGTAVDVICKVFPQFQKPLEESAQTGIFFEVASSRKYDASVGDDGRIKLEEQVLELLAQLNEQGLLLDAMIAQSEQQRSSLWKMRESVLEAITENGPCYHMDICLPLAKIAEFVETMDAALAESGFVPLTVGHLGDGNLHYAIAAAEGQDWNHLPLETIKEQAFALLLDMNGSFSAEHGIGQRKLNFMHDFKQATQVSAMRVIKRALDPHNIMNPGKLVPMDS